MMLRLPKRRTPGRATTATLARPIILTTARVTMPVGQTDVHHNTHSITVAAADTAFQAAKATGAIPEEGPSTSRTINSRLCSMTKILRGTMICGEDSSLFIDLY